MSFTNFEEFPDEILLLIFRYFSSTDILFSFYGLNNRISRTISGFYEHVVLGEVSFQRFNTICTSILPKMSTHIHSLVVSNDWKGVLSKIFLNYFGEIMSSTFPHLKCLILPTYRLQTLMSLIDCLHDLPELDEVKIMSLYDMRENSIAPEMLLDRIFTANNARLTSIVFDDDSLHFSYQTEKIYPNIERLVIELTSVADLHRLLTSLPQLKSIDVTIAEESPAEEMELSIIASVRYFRFRSYLHYWDLDILSPLFKRLPNVEELIIEIITDHDARLIDGYEMSLHLPTLCLKKFSYFLQYENSSSLDDTNILSRWEEQLNQDLISFRSDDRQTFVLFTRPFNVPYLLLDYSLAEKNVFSDNYGSQVRSLTLHEISTRLAEIFPILNKCHCIQRLCVRIVDDIEPRCSKPIALRKLPHLTFFVSLEKSNVEADDFGRLLEAAPNLYHLAVNYEFLRPLFDNESLCCLFEHRITHLLISISWSVRLQSVTESMSRFSSNFPSLKHLYFHLTLPIEPVESLILSVLEHLPEWKSLVSFGVANVTIQSDIVSKGIRQWVIENSFLNDEDSFLTDYSNNTYRLWL